MTNRKAYILRKSYGFLVIMEINTTIQELNGSFYVRIPALMVSYLNLKKKKEATIRDITNTKVEIIFPVW